MIRPNHSTREGILDICAALAKELGLKEQFVQAAIDLMDEGNTVPFIARYRKEATGGMDDIALRKLEERLAYLRNLEQRKEDVILIIGAQGKLTPELETEIRAAEQLQRVEDLYKPYRKKRLTRAQKARNAGLEPLANMIIMQVKPKGTALEAAAGYVNDEAGFGTAEAALAGASDIVAETVAEDPENVADLRAFTQATGALRVVATDADEKTPYEPYYDFDEPLRKIPNHRVLAIDRGEREGKLRVSVDVDDTAALERLGGRWPRRQGVFAPVFDAAIADGYKRLMAPSLAREARAKLTVRAQTEAIQVFAKNLEGLISARPVRGARIIALDPGYRNGCKLAVIDETGKLLDHGIVYPTKPRCDVAGTKRTLARLVKKDRVNTIVIGNGTASREAEEVVSEFIAESAPDVRYTIVNEAGASVYSASEAASLECPDLDVTTRGALSLGRRLQDPLAELVKIPPQSIGVGQYQHREREPARLRLGHHADRRPEHRRLPRGARGLHRPPRAQEGPAARPQGLSQRRGLFAHQRGQKSARRHERPSRELRRGHRAAQARGRRRGRARTRRHPRHRAALREHGYARGRPRLRNPHAHRHHRRAQKARARPARRRTRGRLQPLGALHRRS